MIFLMAGAVGIEWQLNPISHKLGILTSDEKEQIIAFLKKSKLLENVHYPQIR